ncbi:hypothetical protein C8J57DRAFT_1321951, partial [Mycena rebaudengoi]
TLTSSCYLREIPTSDDEPRPGPCLAAVGLACCQCLAEPVAPSLFRKCSGCRLVSYCSPACQTANWAAHKPLCRAISALEKPPLAFWLLKWV